MNVGASAAIDGITITMIRAFHSCETGLPSGYMVELEDPTVIYYAGDTGIWESVGLFEELYGTDLALLPIGSVCAVDTRQAASPLTLPKPNKLVPTHPRLFPCWSRMEMASLT